MDISFVLDIIVLVAVIVGVALFIYNKQQAKVQEIADKRVEYLRYKQRINSLYKRLDRIERRADSKGKKS